MILREELQHGGAGQERFTHSRNFEGHPLLRFAVFPCGMDYHLPHHLFPMIPHYRLRQLHQLLQETEVYRSQALGVESIFAP
jgi:fatty acid desaturase